ncbi:MAG: hypothetical protein H0V77_11930 [Actinobacteria bacterium]|nr:hypothetical protein [Actinomycetota bacterium]
MAQDLRQLGDAELAGSAAAVRVRGQPDFLHQHYLPPWWTSQAKKYHAAGRPRGVGRASEALIWSLLRNPRP